MVQEKVQTEIRDSLYLAVPLAIAQLAQAATGFVDTIMMGWLGRDTLAAGALATSTFAALIVSLTGIIVSVSPLVAEAYGAGDRRRIQQVTSQGLWLALLLSLPMMLLLTQIDRLMLLLGQSASTVATAKTYIDALIWGLFPSLAFSMLKNVVSALSQPRSITVIVFAGTLLNAIGNYSFGFGNFGAPALGLAGLGWASTFSLWFMFLSLVAYSRFHPSLKQYRLWTNLLHLDRHLLRELLWIGVPIGISFALEVGLFTVTTYFMGLFGTTVLAAHQIVFQTIALVFMIPLGISFATTIRVGQWLGQRNLVAAKRSGDISMALGALFMTLMAIVLWVFPQQIIALYLDINDINNQEVIAVATSLFSVAAIAQILDGVQTTAAGALRGLKDTRIPVLLSFLAFWGVGLASGYWLGFHLHLGGLGLWIGQSIGIAMAAGVFGWRFHNLITRKQSAIECCRTL